MVKQREYLLGINSFNKPATVEGPYAICTLLMELILMEPGSNPLKPEMGVGIKNYRYARDGASKLINAIQNQISQYIPEFNTVQVELEELTASKLLNIRINIDGTTYVYDSTTAPVPITLSDLA